MYRGTQKQQQNMHSQAVNYHGRPPESALFEDSPKVRPPPYQHEIGYLPRNQDQFNVRRESEEFGDIQQHEGVMGGVREMTGHDSDDNPEGENDIEYIIMNLYSKMKNLENKYIDLANFYKQELVRSSSKKQKFDDQPERTHFVGGVPQMRSSNISPSRSFERSPEREDLDDTPEKGDRPQEREIIKDLIEEKKRLEEDMKQMMTLRNSSYYQGIAAGSQQSPLKKQTDYQSSSWYDPKNRQALQMVQPEFKAHNQGSSKQSQLHQVRQQDNESQQQMAESFRDIQVANSRFLQDMEKELTQFKRKSDYFQMNVQKLKGSLKYKENNLRDDQLQMQTLLRDLYQNIQSLESREYLILSGEKGQNPGVLSPFEKRLQNYQKSAEMRKESNTNPLNRSGSRGRPGMYPSTTNTGSNFYRAADYNSNQGFNSGAGGIDSQDQQSESMVIKSKFKHFQRLFEDYNIKTNTIIQEEQEINKIVDDTFQDQGRFLKIADNLLNSLIAQKQGNFNNSSSTAQIRGNKQQQNAGVSPLSPTYTKYDGSEKFNQASKFNQQEQKLSELQRHNDQLFAQLRQANEKYLDERVETNKLAGEIKQLSKTLDDTKAQLRKIQSESSTPGIKQQIRKHSQQRNEQPGSVKQSSYNSATASRENDELKKRVQELEKECLTLTYYNQDAQRVGSISSDPYVRQMQQENQEVKNNFSQICLQVQEFLMSMRRLQRAVNNKDKDIAVYKSDFERVKKGLEHFIQETKESQENKGASSSGHQTFAQVGKQNSSMMAGFGREISNHHSMIISQEKRDSRFGQEATGAGGGMTGPQRNKSQAPLGSGAQNRSSRVMQPPVYPITQRPEGGNHHSDQLYQQHQQHPIMGSSSFKKGIIKPKHNNFIQSPSPQNEAAIHQQQQQQDQSSSSYHGDFQQSPSQEQKFNRLLEEIRQTEEQAERQRHQIEDLKSVNEMLLAEKNAAEIKCSSKALNVQKLSQQVKLVNERVKQQEQLIDEYKAGLVYLEGGVQTLNKLAVSKIKTELMIRERELFNGVMRESSSMSSLNSKKQQQEQQQQQQKQSINIAIVKQLREELTQQIEIKEKEFEAVIGEINKKLQAKEQDLGRVKKLFVDKLRELESSFNEISQEMIDSEQVQQETSKRYQQQLVKQSQSFTQQQQNQQQKSELEKSIENAIGRVDDEEREEELEKLVAANEELLEQNSELRGKLRQMVEMQGEGGSEEYKGLKEEVALLKEDNEELEQQVRQLREDEFNVQKSLDNLKIEHKKVQALLQDTVKQKEQVQQEYQKQLNELEDQLQNSISTLQQEQEQRVFFQSQSNNKEKQLKIMRNDKQALQNDNDRLTKAEQELLVLIEQTKQEQEYMSHLRREKDKDSFSGDGQGEGDDSLFVDEMEEEKIAGNPTESAKSYYRMLKATKKEFLILNKAHDKLQDKYQEQKDELKELRQESRKDAENNINRESRLFELENSNQRLIQELEKTKGQYVVEEDAIRQEIEAHFRERLAFKETEVESMTDKLARITQTNSEMNTKILRLESNINELSSENEIMKDKIQSLEMELEMTKCNSERDTEQLMEQQQQREEMQKIIIESERAKEQNKTAEQIRKIDAQRQELEQKLRSAQEEQKKQQMSGKIMESLKSTLESKLQEIQKELEVEKEYRLESEKQRLEQEKQQEIERKGLIQQQEIERNKLINQYQNQIQQEKSKQQEQEQLKKQLEKDLIQRHQEEKERLEQRLSSEREQQESRLLESEKEKIERVRKEMQEEKERQLKEKEELVRQQAHENLEQLRQRLEEEKQAEIKQKENESKISTQQQEQTRKELEQKLQIAIKQAENEKQKNSQQLQAAESEKQKVVLAIKEQLAEQQQSILKQSKQSKLVQALQKHAREAILRELDNEKALREAREQQSQEELARQAEEYQQEMERLQQINKDELNLIQVQLQSESEYFKKEKKKLILVQVLQNKARESLLNQLEQERIKAEEKEYQEQQDIQQFVEENELKVQELEQKLILQNQQSKAQLKQLHLAQAMLIMARDSILKDYQHLQESRLQQQSEEQERVFKLTTDHENVLMKMNEVKMSQIKLLESKIQHDQEIAKKDKKALSLVKVLQQKARQVLFDELELSKQARQKDQQTIQERINGMEAEHQKKVQDLQAQKEEHQKKLEKLIQSNENNNLAMRQMRLVYSLQIQARKSILKQLEDEKIAKQKLNEQAIHEQQRLNTQIQKLQQSNELEISKLKGQVQQMEVDSQMEIEQIREEHQNEIDHLNEELNKVKKEQEDLVNSLSQQQDQQTKDLLAQKDNEAKHLVAEITHKHQQEISEKEKHARMIQVMHDKIRTELEGKIQESVQEKEELLAQMEQDMQLLNQDQDEQLESLKLQSHEEQESLRLRFEQENLEKQKALLQMEQKLEETKEHQRQMLQKFSESKQEELDLLRKQYNDLQLDNDELLNQLNNEQEQFQQDNEKLQHDHQQQIEGLNAQINKLVQQVKLLESSQSSEQKQFNELLKKEQEQHTQALKEKNLEISNLRQEQEVQAIHMQELNQQMLDQLKAKLEHDHQEEITKKSSEKNIFEKMQQKVREELQTQLQQSELAKQEQMQKLADCQLDISKRELQQQAERISQQEHIDNLNQMLSASNKAQEELKQDHQKVQKELETMKKQQQESENSLLKEMRAKVDNLIAQNEKLSAEIKTKENELVEVKEKLRLSQKEVGDLEKDMDQFSKDMDEERAQNDIIKEQTNQQIQQLQTQISQKENENKELQDLRQKDKNQIQDLETQLAQLKLSHDQELKQLNEQNNQLQGQVEDAGTGTVVINESIDHIEAKIGEFDIELGKVKKLEKQLEQQQQLNDSLINNANNDKDQQIINQIGQASEGSTLLQYVKRVKYLEKAWILIQQQQNYYWIDQDNIPVQKLQTLQIDTVEDLGAKLSDQLELLQQEKEKIIQLVNEKRTPKSSYTQQSANENLKQELADLQLAHNTLQQNNLQLKQRINELNEMIFGMADTDKDHENMKKIVELHKKSEDLIKKLRLQIDETKKFENEVEEKQQEIDALKKQMNDQEYSFAKGAEGKSFNQSSKPDNFPLEASSIGRDPDEESFNQINVEVVNEPVQIKLKRLEQEVEEYQRLQKGLEDSNRSLQVELIEVKAKVGNTGQGSARGNDKDHNEAEMQDHLKHTRSILIKFLEKVPITSKENEDLLPIVYSMMLFTKEEMNGLMAIRQASAEKLMKEQQKKGVFGMFGKGKEKK